MFVTFIAQYLQHFIKESAHPESEGLDSANKHPPGDFAPHETLGTALGLLSQICCPHVKLRSIFISRASIARNPWVYRGLWRTLQPGLGYPFRKHFKWYLSPPLLIMEFLFKKNNAPLIPFRHNAPMTIILIVCFCLVGYLERRWLKGPTYYT